MKKCSKCGETKPVDEFSKNRTHKDGLHSQCKSCQKQYREANKDRIKKYLKEYSEQNKDSIKEYGIQYREANKDLIAEKAKVYYAANKDQFAKRYKAWREHKRGVLRKYHSEWRDKNREHVRESGRKNQLSRIKSSLKNKLNSNFSLSIRRSLPYGSKANRHWEDLVGYTVEDLKRHLEKQFTEGMTWENHGKWHIDHIIPISAFNFEMPEHEDFKRCWALKNLQPLWAVDNWSKSNKLGKPFQPRLALSL